MHGNLLRGAVLSKPSVLLTPGILFLCVCHSFIHPTTIDSDGAATAREALSVTKDAEVKEALRRSQRLRRAVTDVRRHPSKLCNTELAGVWGTERS